MFEIIREKTLYTLAVSGLIIVTVFVMRLVGIDYLQKGSVVWFIVIIVIAYAATIVPIHLNEQFSIIDFAIGDTLEEIINKISPSLLLLSLFFIIINILRLSSAIYVNFFIYNFILFFIYNFNNRSKMNEEYTKVKEQLDQQRFDQDRFL